MPIGDLWYRNAIIYCLDVETYMDGNGDGVGDFQGLSERLPYLAGLGVTCLWLLPFFRSPNRDNGYDISDYYSVDPRHGTLGDFVEFTNLADSLGLRVIIDLVANHTSSDHPWFQHARRDRNSPHRDWYIWSDKRPAMHADGVVFSGVQTSTWTWDAKARQYYFHRFYQHQPDLNTANPDVRREILKVMGFWLDLGISGFRMDAVPFLIEQKGTSVRRRKNFEMLHEMRDFVQWRRRDAVLLAEANVPPRENLKYFGPQGDRLQMMLNFPVNQRLWYALASGNVAPLAHAIEQTSEPPVQAQYVQFLRSHDECDLGRLTAAQRQAVFDACGPDRTMQLYHRGVRRRFAPMLNGDRRRIELAFSLLFTLPGTPLIQYGDEIGIWDDLSLAERSCGRTAMQWSSEHYGGFSRASRVKVPIVAEAAHGFKKINVVDQRRQPDSLLNWVERRIRARRQLPEIGWGRCQVVATSTPGVLVLCYSWRGTALVTVHNFRDDQQVVRFSIELPDGEQLCDYFNTDHSTADARGVHEVVIRPYGHTWYRVGKADPEMNRTPF